MSAIPWVGQDIVESNNTAKSLITLTTIPMPRPPAGQVYTGQAGEKQKKNKG